MLTLLARILKVLNSEASPWQIGWGIGLGLLAGLLPFGLLTLLILLLVCLLTVNLATFLLVWGLCSGLMFIFGDALESLTWQYAKRCNYFICITPWCWVPLCWACCYCCRLPGLAPCWSANIVAG